MPGETEATSKFERRERELSLYGRGRFTFCPRALQRVDSSVVGATTSEPHSLIDAGNCVPRWFQFRRPNRPKNQGNQGKLRHRPLRNASRQWIWNRRNSDQAGTCCSLVQSIRSGATGWDRADVRERVGIIPVVIKANRYFKAVQSVRRNGLEPIQNAQGTERRHQAANAWRLQLDNRSASLTACRGE